MKEGFSRRMAGREEASFLRKIWTRCEGKLVCPALMVLDPHAALHLLLFNTMCIIPYSLPPCSVDTVSPAQYTHNEPSSMLSCTQGE